MTTVTRNFVWSLGASCALVLGSLLLGGCPERPQRYVDDVDGGGAAFDEVAIKTWQHCPPRSISTPLEGTLWVQTTANAEFCRPAKNSETADEAFAAKSQIRLVATDVFLPLEEGTTSLDFASCRQTRHQGVQGAASDGAGTWTVTASSVLGTPYLEGVLRQPLDDGSVVEMAITGLSASFQPYTPQNPGGVLIDGKPRPLGVAPDVVIRLCQDAECVESDVYTPCVLPDPVGVTSRFGKIEVEMANEIIAYDLEYDRLDSGMTILRQAQGSFGGQAISVTSRTTSDAYWFTEQRPQTSGYRGWGLYLDPPIDNVCQIRIDGVPDFQSNVLAALYSCGSNDIAYVRVSASPFTRINAL